MANALLLRSAPLVGVDRGATAPGFSAAAVGNDYAGIVWRSAMSAGSEFILDLGRNAPVDTIMLFGLRGMNAASTLQVFALADGGDPLGNYDWGDQPRPLLAGSIMPASGRGVAFWEPPAGAPAAARYWLMRFASPSATQIEVAVAVAGSAIRLERNFSFGAGFGVRDLGSLDFSRRGVLLRNRGTKLRTASLTFSSIRKDEVEQLTGPLLERIGNTECVALVTDPVPDAQRQRRCYYGPLVGDLGQTWRRANAFEAKANIVSLF